MAHKTRLGPVAVFLTIVAMVITTLALLTVATSNADRVMAGRFASITQTRYELEADGEKFIAAVASGTADGMEGVTAGPLAEDTEDDIEIIEETGSAAGAESALSDAAYSFAAEKDGYRLEVEAGAPDADGNVEIIRWKLSRIWNSRDPIENIWQGF